MNDYPPCPGNVDFQKMLDSDLQLWPYQHPEVCGTGGHIAAPEEWHLETNFRAHVLERQMHTQEHIKSGLALPYISPELPKVTVYFIQCLELRGPIKIGIASNLERRLNQIQAASPFELVVLHSFIGTKKDEQRLHKRFATWRLHGEWFQPVLAITDYIKELRNGH